MLYNNITIGGEIYHHGVKGMKWGVRRYQPYGSGYKGSSGKFVGDVNKQSGWRTKTANSLNIASKVINAPGEVINNTLLRKTNTRITNPVSMVLDMTSNKLKEKDKNKETKKKEKQITINKDEIQQQIKELQNLSQKQSEAYNKTCETVDEEVTRIMNTKEFKEDLDNRLHEDFGNGCDDEEFFNMIRDEHLYDMVYEDKYSSKKVKKELNNFHKLNDEYFDTLHKYVDEITESYKSKNLESTKELQDKYRNKIDNILKDESDAHWAAYLYRHGDDYLYENVPDLSTYTMREYNKKHSSER